MNRRPPTVPATITKRSCRGCLYSRYRVNALGLMPDNVGEYHPPEKLHDTCRDCARMPERRDRYVKADNKAWPYIFNTYEEAQTMAKSMNI